MPNELQTLFKTLAFTGHRPKDLPSSFGNDYTSPGWVKTIDMIKNAIRTFNTNKIITGGAMGMDTAAALAAQQLKDEGYDIFSEIVVPFKGQEAMWSSQDKSIYNDIISKADNVKYLADTFLGNSQYQIRNKNMVDNADALISLWNGKPSGGTYNTIKYANSKNKPIYNLYKTLVSDLNKS